MCECVCECVCKSCEILGHTKWYATLSFLWMLLFLRLCRRIKNKKIYLDIRVQKKYTKSMPEYAKSTPRVHTPRLFKKYIKTTIQNCKLDSWITEANSSPSPQAHSAVAKQLVASGSAVSPMKHLQNVFHGLDFKIYWRSRNIDFRWLFLVEKILFSWNVSLPIL